jgi:hypothetical protein
MLLPSRCWSSATSASSPHGTPTRRKTPAAPPGACPRKPASGDARPSPPSPRRHNPPRAHAAEPHHQDKDGGSMPATSQEKAQRNHTDTQRSRHAGTSTATPNVRPKRENRPHRNVKTSRVRRQGLEPRTRGLRVRCSVRFCFSTWYHLVPHSAATCRTVRQAHESGCRVMPAATGPYRDIRANMEQTWATVVRQAVDTFRNTAC